MKFVIIKYNAGNIQSVGFALQRSGIDAVITDDPDMIRNADKVIFPGVGEAASTMKFLVDKGLDLIIKGLKQPVLAICLGQQLLCKNSEEGNTECLGVFEQGVKRFPAGNKVPHIGWNTLTNLKSQLFDNIEERSYVYFVHSYYTPVCGDTIATCNYIVNFSAAMKRNNFYATQFHPEKSGDIGHLILQNFIRL